MAATKNSLVTDVVPYQLAPFEAFLVDGENHRRPELALPNLQWRTALVMPLWTWNNRRQEEENPKGSDTM